MTPALTARSATRSSRVTGARPRTSVSFDACAHCAPRSKSCARRTYEVQEVPQSELPLELQQTGLTFAGARGPNYTYWLTDTFEAARPTASPGRSAVTSCSTTCSADQGVDRARQLVALALHPSQRPNERDLLLSEEPVTTCGPFPVRTGAACSPASASRRRAGGRAAATWQLGQPRRRLQRRQRHQAPPAGPAQRRPRRRPDARDSTWLSVRLRRALGSPTCRRPSVGGTRSRWAATPKQWLERLWTGDRRGPRLPARQRAARARLTTSATARALKSWSLHVLDARALSRTSWLPLIDAVSKQHLSEQESATAFREVLGKPVEEIERDWRRWARRDSALGRASGWVDGDD